MNVEVLGDDVCYGSMATMYDAMMARVRRTPPGRTVRIPASALNRGISPNSVTNKQLRETAQKMLRTRQQQEASIRTGLFFPSFLNRLQISGAVLKPVPVTYNGSYLGGDAWDAVAGFFTKAVNVVSKGLTSETGKAVVSAGMTAVAGRISQTDKAKIANAQAAAGMDPQALTGGGNTFVNWPKISEPTSMIPLAIGGVALLALMAMMFKISR